jgi:hypothetical protein
MREEQPVSRSRRIIVSTLLLIFLVGMPLVSYIYLKKGYDYQLEALSDLRKTHRLTDHSQLRLLYGTQPEEDLFGNMYILGLLPNLANPSFPRYGEVLTDLHEQFDLPENIQFWTVFENKDSTFAANYQTSHQMAKDTNQLLYWTVAEQDYESFVAQLGLLEQEKNFLPNGLLVLVDDSLYVRRAYQLDKEADVKQLVERIAILLPERKKPKPEVKRKEEL